MGQLAPPGRSRSAPHLWYTPSQTVTCRKCRKGAAKHSGQLHRVALGRNALRNSTNRSIAFVSVGVIGATTSCG